MFKLDKVGKTSDTSGDKHVYRSNDFALKLPAIQSPHMNSPNNLQFN